jgi:deoxyribodipyrimidine photolyase-related protein
VAEVVLIFPHHLFKKHPALDKARLICFVEDPLFFSDEKYPTSFHKQKIAFHRASMKQFCLHLEEKGYQTRYLDAHLIKKPADYLSCLRKLHPKVIHIAESDDFLLEKRLKEMMEKLQISLSIHPSPQFLTPITLYKEMLNDKAPYFFHTFYIEQRKRLGILIDDRLKPIGGKWSFDTENRKKAPKGLCFPSPWKAPQTAAIKEALSYTELHFSSHLGDIQGFNYPTTHSDAKKTLRHFLENKLKHFGCYEDAMLVEEPVLFHSVLSPLLNSGLITPQEVIEETLEYAKDSKIPLNALEGFLRQVIGWREYIRGIYHTIGLRQRNSNFFHHTKKMPNAFYTASTGIIPVDHCIKNALSTGYCHHIERLMVLGNFFLLCEIDPSDIYKWFMELFIDSYDWVMVPNVYGMSQYADGGLMTTKPYISGSNYILKMSNFPKGPWTEIWDSLFWRFMNKHTEFFAKQPRLNMLCQMAKKKALDKELTKKGELFLRSLHE